MFFEDCQVPDKFGKFVRATDDRRDFVRDLTIPEKGTLARGPTSKTRTSTGPRCDAMRGHSAFRGEIESAASRLNVGQARSAGWMRLG